MCVNVRGANLWAIFRIDARTPSEGYRIDRYGICGFEAIDGGQGAVTLSDAKAFAASYLDAIVAQGTLTPSHPHVGCNV